MANPDTPEQPEVQVDRSGYADRFSLKLFDITLGGAL
jgi:hypothetical protein